MSLASATQPFVVRIRESYLPIPEGAPVTIQLRLFKLLKLPRYKKSAFILNTL